MATDQEKDQKGVTLELTPAAAAATRNAVANRAEEFQKLAAKVKAEGFISSAREITAAEAVLREVVLPKLNRQIGHPVDPQAEAFRALDAYLRPRIRAAIDRKAAEEVIALAITTALELGEAATTRALTEAQITNRDLVLDLVRRAATTFEHGEVK